MVCSAWIPAAFSQTPIRIVKQGQDFVTYERVTPVGSRDGRILWRTNRFTLLENGLHYWEDGVWKKSRDVIELCSKGAVAPYGPNKAIFSSDLSSPVVFDIQMADGRRLQGGIRAIQVTDLTSGQTLVLGKVKPSVPGEFIHRTG